MTSIRKTKKRLKREIAETWADYKRYDPRGNNIWLYEAVADTISDLKQELENLKRKKQWNK